MRHNTRPDTRPDTRPIRALIRALIRAPIRTPIAGYDTRVCATLQHACPPANVCGCGRAELSGSRGGSARRAAGCPGWPRLRFGGCVWWTRFCVCDQLFSLCCGCGRRADVRLSVERLCVCYQHRTCDGTDASMPVTLIIVDASMVTLVIGLVTGYKAIFL